MPLLKLVRDKSTGCYYTVDRHFLIEKGSVGWNIYEIEPDGLYSLFPWGFDETLSDVRKSIFLYYYEGGI